MSAINHDEQPLLSTQVNPRNQELFSFKDTDGKHYSVINIDGSKWTTKQGWELVPRTDAIEFQYYTIDMEFREAYKNTVPHLIKNSAINETPGYKQRQTLAFMNYRQNTKIHNTIYCTMLWIITGIFIITGLLIAIIVPLYLDLY